MHPKIMIFFVLIVGFQRTFPAEETAEYKSGFFIYPVLFYTPETSWGYGATAQIFTYPKHAGRDARPSSWIPMLIYTTKRQTLMRLTQELYLGDEKIHWFGTAFWTDYPDKFYGIGNQTDKQQEETFTRRGGGMWTIPQIRLSHSLYAGLELDYFYQELTDLEEDGALSIGSIPGTRPHDVLGLGINLFRDTRDNQFYPASGCYHQFHYLAYSDAWGSDFNYQRMQIDLRRYFTIHKKNIFAIQAYCQAISGNPPFQMMSKLGGSNSMRGYYEGRFRDRNMLMIQAEFKRDLWRFIDFVLFGGAGDVAHTLNDFRLGTLKPSYGAGLRFQVNPEKITVRLDYGMGEESSGVYIEVNEAF